MPPSGAGATPPIQGNAIYRIDLLDTPTGLAAFPSPAHLILRLTKRTHFEKLTYRQPTDIHRRKSEKAASNPGDMYLGS